VRDPDGRVFIVEHKTSSEDISPGSDYFRRLRLNSQVSAYYLGAASLGYDVQGCLYDVLKKPQQKPLQANARRAVAETPDEYEARVGDAIAEDPNAYYQRAMLVRLEDELREAQRDLWLWAGIVREAQRLNAWPRNPDACVRYGSTCAFFDVCTGQGSLDDAERYVRVGPHPELAAPAA
jgi:hypothetical protein